MNKEELYNKRREIVTIERLLTKEERSELREINKKLDLLEGVLEKVSEELPELTEDQIIQQNKMVEEILNNIRNN